MRTRSRARESAGDGGTRRFPLVPDVQGGRVPEKQLDRGDVLLRRRGCCVGAGRPLPLLRRRRDGIAERDDAGLRLMHDGAFLDLFVRFLLSSLSSVLRSSALHTVVTPPTRPSPSPAPTPPLVPPSLSRAVPPSLPSLPSRQPPPLPTLIHYLLPSSSSSPPSFL
jgi:hypothetical protein